MDSIHPRTSPPKSYSYIFSSRGFLNDFFIEVGSEDRMKKGLVVHLNRKTKKININAMKIYVLVYRKNEIKELGLTNLE